MKTVHILLLAGIIVVSGRWSQDKKIDLGIAVAMAVGVLGTAILSNLIPEVGQPFAYLLLVSALLVYAVPLFQKLKVLK